MIALIAILIASVIIGLSIRANNRFQRHGRLPMQWSFAGQVNWTAPRVVALSFMPVLATTILMLFVIASITIPPRTGQEDAVIPTLLAMGSLFVAAHLFHLWLIARTLARCR